jgi:hypothetical protein
MLLLSGDANRRGSTHNIFYTFPASAGKWIVAAGYYGIELML